MQNEIYVILFPWTILNCCKHTVMDKIRIMLRAHPKKNSENLT